MWSRNHQQTEQIHFASDLWRILIVWVCVCVCVRLCVCGVCVCVSVSETFRSHIYQRSFKRLPAVSRLTVHRRCQVCQVLATSDPIIFRPLVPSCTNRSLIFGHKWTNIFATIGPFAHQTLSLSRLGASQARLSSLLVHSFVHQPLSLSGFGDKWTNLFVTIGPLGLFVRAPNRSLCQYLAKSEPSFVWPLVRCPLSFFRKPFTVSENYLP